VPDPISPALRSVLAAVGRAAAGGTSPPTGSSTGPLAGVVSVATPSTARAACSAAAARRCARVGLSVSTAPLAVVSPTPFDVPGPDFTAPGCDFGRSRGVTCTASASRSTFSLFSKSVSDSFVGPNHGSPLKSPCAGWPTKDTGLKRCSAAKASASSSVSRGTTATCTFDPLPDQSNTRSSTL